ncbi:MAG: hypothetical protein ACRDRJ_07350 [Streptosporangiaceae bacterium]
MVGVGVLVGLGDFVGDGDVLVGDGLGLVLVGDGVGLVVFVDVGDVLGLVVLLVLVPVLGFGVTLFDVLALLVGVTVADVLLLRVGSALVGLVLVGLVLVDLLADGSTLLVDGLTLADADRRGVVVPVGELVVPVGELVVGVTLAEVDPPVEEVLELGLVLPLVLAVPLALVVVAACRALWCRPAGLLRCWLAGWIAEASRTAALGRLAQAPFTIGGPPPLTRSAVAPKASALDARSTNPAKAPSAIGRTSRTLAFLTSTTLTL